MRRLINHKTRSNTELIDILRSHKHLGSGANRATFLLNNDTVIKLPLLTRDYQKKGRRHMFYYNDGTRYSYSRYVEELDFLISDDIDKILDEYRYSDDSLEAIYVDEISQSLEEAYIAQTIESPLLLPMIECGFFECGIFYSIFPKIQIFDDMNISYDYRKQFDEAHALLKHIGGSIEEFEEECERIQEKYGLSLEDCFDNSGNFGVYKGRIICCDYGLSSSECY